MMNRSIVRTLGGMCLALVAFEFATVTAAAQENSAQESSIGESSYQSLTAGDPEISIDQLKVLLRPLTKDNLQIEASEWLKKLNSKITVVGEAELKMMSLAEGDDSTDLTHQLVKLRTQESDLVAHMRVVLSALKAKGGDIEESEQYLNAVTDLGETTDSTSYWVAIAASFKIWAESEDGGKSMVRRIAFALVMLLIFWVMSKFAGGIVARVLARQSQASVLLENFARRTTGGVVLIVGFLMALSVMGVEIGPMMAALGAGGFIVGFALQETLASFASGLMIMVYRPFDVGDYISISGDDGTVQEMSLVSTKLLTVDNKVIVVPNKKAWSDTITNYTGKKIRRVDLIFGISYDDDIRQAIDVLTEIAGQHPDILDEPKLNVGVTELADSSVNLFCRPWVKTEDYWTVYWDLTQQVKERFDAVGLSFPYPQRDVHLDTAVNPTSEQEA